MSGPAIAASAFLAVLAAAARAGPAPEPEPKPDPYPAGETLQYRVKLMGLPAGIATMKVGSRGKSTGRQTAGLVLDTKPSALARAIAKYQLKVTSLVDVATGGTLSFRIDESVRGKRKIKEFAADPITHVVKSLRHRPPGPEDRREMKAPGPVHDVLSMFYQLRRMKLDLGKFENLTVFQGHKRYEGRLATDGLEQIKVKGVGVFWALVVHPTAGMPGLFSEKGHATIWLEETTHVMLRMVVEGGKVGASLALIRAENSPLFQAPGAFRRRK